MARSALRLAATATAVAVLALAPALAGAAGDPPPKTAPGTKSGLPSSSPGGVEAKAKPDLYVSAIGYSGGAVSLAIRNQGQAVAGSSKWRVSCALDPGQPGSCAASFKPSENAGVLHVCPGFQSLSPQEGATPALEPGQAHGASLPKPFKAGCRYKITIEADAARQVTESNEDNNSNVYVVVGK